MKDNIITTMAKTLLNFLDLFLTFLNGSSSS